MESSAQSQNDELSLNSAYQFDQQLKDLKKMFSLLPSEKQRRLSVAINKITEASVSDDSTPPSSKYSSFNRDTAGQKRRSLNFSILPPPKERKMSTIEKQGDSGIQLYNESSCNSKFMTDDESELSENNSLNSTFGSSAKLVTSSPK